MNAYQSTSPEPLPNDGCKPSGIIPICASCKKVRDSHGNWNVADNLYAYNISFRMSHGLCPDCVHVLYPDFELRPETKSAPHNDFVIQPHDSTQ
jgi:hypothetical protein